MTTPSAARRVHRVTLVLAVAGALLTILLVSVTHAAHVRNEARLLRQRTREAATVLTAAIPSIESPLRSAAAIVTPDDSGAATLRALFGPLVGTGGRYVSASVWRLQQGGWVATAVEGLQPKMAVQPPDVVADLARRAITAKGMAVVGLLSGDDPRLGYGYPVGTAGDMMIYAEAGLPADRTAVVPRDTAFFGLQNAVYLGDQQRADALLTASTDHLPLSGRHVATERVPFGDSSLLLVMSPVGELGGELLRWLPPLVGGVGLLTTTGAAVLTEALARRRDHATREAGENAQLYWTERAVAETLQKALLPDRLPDVTGLQFAARYIAGVAGVHIGGDWYDVIEVDDHRALVVVGDVSGRGLPAATVMGELRYSIRAFASEGHGPGDILNRLTRLLDVRDSGHFATVLCALIDGRDHTVTFATAGHPGPLVVDATGCRGLDVQPGPPIGVVPGAVYVEQCAHLTDGAALFAFTDGLFERRGESIDDGLARLCETAGRSGGSIEQRIEEIVRGQTTTTAFDDTAILGVSWTTP